MTTEELLLKISGDSKSAETALASTSDRVRSLDQATRAAADAAGLHNEAMQRQVDLLPGFLAKYLEARTIYDLAGESYHAFTELISSSVEAYGQAEAAITRLKGGLEAVGQVTPNLIEEYASYADALERTTTVSKTAALEAAGTFTLIGSVGPEQMQRALKAAADFSAVTGRSFEQAAMAIAKATDGNVGQLQRFGVQIDKSTVESEGIEAVFDAIEEKMHGQAELLSGTLLGSWQQISNQWEHAKEQLGGELAPAVSFVAGALKTFVSIIAESPGAFLGLIASSATLAGAMAWMAALGVYGEQLSALATIIGGELTSQIVLLTGVTTTAEGSVLGLSAAETTLAETSAIAAGSVLGLSEASTVAGAAAVGAATKTIGWAAALPSVAAGFAGWMVGKWIGDVTGLTSAFDRLVNFTNDTSTATDAAAMRLETVRRAVLLGAPPTIAYGDALKYVQEKLQGVAAASESAAKGSQAWITAVRSGTAAIEAHRIVTESLTAATGTVSRELSRIPAADLAVMMRELHDNTATSTDAFKRQADQMGLSAVTVQFLHDRVKSQDEATKSATQSTEQWDREIGNLIQTISGAKVAEDVERLATAVQWLGGGAALTATEFTHVATEAAKLKAAGAELTPTLDAIVLRFQQMKGTSDSLAAIGRQVKDIPVAAGFEDNSWATRMTLASRSLADVSLGLINVNHVAAAAAQTMSQLPPIDWVAIFKEDITEVSQSILLAFGPGGNIGRSMATGATALGVDAGAKMTDSITNELWAAGKGGKLTNILDSLGGPLGAAAVGLGLDLGKKLWNSLFGTAGRDAVTDFVTKNYGTFDALHAQLNGLGAEGETLWKNLTQGVGRNNPDQAKAAIDAITTALQKQTASIKTESDALNGQLGTALSSLQGFGGKLDASFQPYLDKLKAAGLITDQNASLMDQLLGTGGPSLQKLTELQQRYNLTADQMGPAFTQATDNATWQQLFDDLKTATDGGLNLDGVLQGMSPSISKLVQDSLQFGTTIPSNMEETVKKLAAQGQLLDANGNKITDISKLNFGGEELQASVDKLVLSIQALIDKLTSIPGAIQAIPKAVNVDANVTYRTTDTTGGRTEGASTGALVGPHGLIPLAFARGGLVDWSPIGPDTIPAMLRPGEIVLNAAQQGRIAGALSASAAPIGDVHITVDMSGAVVRSDGDIRALGNEFGAQVDRFIDTIRRDGTRRMRLNQAIG